MLSTQVIILKTIHILTAVSLLFKIKKCPWKLPVWEGLQDLVLMWFHEWNTHVMSLKMIQVKIDKLAVKLIAFE